jgi:hypothetical protein
MTSSRRHDVLIVLAAGGWAAAFVVSLAVPAFNLDPTLNLVLMAVVGALVALRQRQEETT